MYATTPQRSPVASMFAATSMPSRDWWASLFPDPSGLLRTLGVREGMPAPDLCCGDGYFTAPLARIVGGRVYALDFDPDLIARARRASRTACSSLTRARQDFLARSTVAVDRFSRAISTN